jgi:hypothetical protein
MRAGPLSNNDVISILNRYFVPVYTSNEVSGPNGTGTPEERAALHRIVSSFERARLGTGDVLPMRNHQPASISARPWIPDSWSPRLPAWLKSSEFGGARRWWRRIRNLRRLPPNQTRGFK